MKKKQKSAKFIFPQNMLTSSNFWKIFFAYEGPWSTPSMCQIWDYFDKNSWQNQDFNFMLMSAKRLFPNFCQNGAWWIFGPALFEKIFISGIRNNQTFSSIRGGIPGLEYLYFLILRIFCSDGNLLEFEVNKSLQLIPL